MKLEHDKQQIENDMVAHHAAMHPYQHIFDLWSKSSTNRRPTTIEDYWKVLLEFADAIERKSLSSITRKDVVYFRDLLLERGVTSVPV